MTLEGKDLRMQRHIRAKALLIGMLAACYRRASAQGPQGMRDSEFIPVVLATFQFHAGVNLLVLTAYGFILARAWPEGQGLDKGKAFNALPGLLFISVAIVLTGWQYTEIGQAVSSNTVVTYAGSWSSYSYLIQLLQALAALAIALPLRR